MADLRTVRLAADTPLPCGNLRNGQPCGRPATIATGNPYGDKTAGALWLLLPVCAECARALWPLSHGDSTPART